MEDFGHQSQTAPVRKTLAEMAADASVQVFIKFAIFALCNLTKQA
jgi:hypothetical protein